jgi:hypothetical protein
VASPSTGYYYLSIYAYSSYSSVTIEASYTEGSGGVTTLEIGQAVTNLSSSQGEWLRYFVNVPSGASNLQISISGGTGDADLYTRYDLEPTTSAWDCRPYEYGNNETCSVASPSTGTYHVGIRAYSAFSKVTLVASYD